MNERKPEVLKCLDLIGQEMESKRLISGCTPKNAFWILC